MPGDDLDKPEHRLPALVRLARPKQWLKNVLVVAAPGAAGVLTQAQPAFRTGIAFVCFCIAASGTYFLNDAIDVNADRRHPIKRTRPVAAGEVGISTAIGWGLVLCVAAIALSFTARWQLALVVGGYLVLTFSYSLWLKHEPVLDLGAVACGFVLRAIAGGIAVGVSISPWFLIVAGSGSLFMVTGKRSAELRALGTERPPPVARRVHRAVPGLRTRGLVERGHPRVLPLGVREVGTGRHAGPVPAVDHSLRARSAALRAAARAGTGWCARRARPLRSRAPRRSVWHGCCASGSRFALADGTSSPAGHDEVLTGWGRTAPESRPRLGTAPRRAARPAHRRGARARRDPARAGAELRRRRAERRR